MLGLALSLNSASGAFGAVGRALNRVWRVDEGRGFVRRKANDLVWTLVVLVLVLVTFVLDLPRRRARVRRARLDRARRHRGRRLADRALAGGARRRRCSIYAVVYFAAPNVEVRRFQWITPGAVFGVLTWIVASALFFLYVSNFSSYSATYGAFAAAVILLVWLWLTNVVLLFGAELNAVIDLRRSPELPRSYDGPPLPAKEPGRVLVGGLGGAAASSPPARSRARRGRGSRRRARGAAARRRASRSASTPAGEREQRVGERRRVGLRRTSRRPARAGRSSRQ